MSINNFDQSSSGVNLSLDIFWDGDRGRSDYDESIIDVNDTLVFSMFGNLDVSDWEPTYKTPNSANKLFRDYFKQVNELDISLASYSRVKSLLQGLECSVRDSAEEMLNAIEEYENNPENFSHFLAQHYEKDFYEVETKGYCQGDVKTVVIPNEVFAENGEEPSQENAEDWNKTISNLCWDQPLYCRIKIDGEEFDLVEDVKDSYSYDKDEIIKNFDNQYNGTDKDYIRTWLSESLPSHPDYK